MDMHTHEASPANTASAPAPAEQPAEPRRSLLDRRLRLQMRIFLVVFVVLLALSVWHVLRDHVSPLWLLVGLLPGMALGVALARTKVLGWDADARSVVGRSDRVGIVILVAYIAFVLLGRDALLGYWVHSAAAASVVSLAMTAGAMLTRIAVTLHGIRGVLRAAGIAIPERGRPSTR